MVDGRHLARAVSLAAIYPRGYGGGPHLAQEGVPHCKRCGGIIKPDVVLFEEGIDYNAITDSIRATQEADLLLVVGSSLVVYPAAGIPNYFKGNNIAIINKNSTPLDEYAKLVIHDDIKKVFSELK